MKYKNDRAATVGDPVVGIGLASPHIIAGIVVGVSNSSSTNLRVLTFQERPPEAMLGQMAVIHGEGAIAKPRFYQPIVVFGDANQFLHAQDCLAGKTFVVPRNAAGEKV